jgi:hypothetical protein
MKSHIASGSFKCVAGFLFCVWMNDGKRMGSLMKKIGVLFPTRSQFPVVMKWLQMRILVSEDRLKDDMIFSD